ncbi:MAG: ATP-binding protein [Candidatus Parvarchaeota archaeon]|nr:ATP-binding protein [Candidatus Parvarchaeota archaeon]
MQIDDLEKFNAWWKGIAVRKELLQTYKRQLYALASRYLNRRQILLIYGLRRVGKTVILFQLIDELLSKGIDPKNILYFSFDELVFDLKDVLDSYQMLILKRNFDEASGKIYLFLDEIQKVKDWESKLKIVYDLYPNVKIVISGSAAVNLRKKAKESLAGRIIDLILEPLSFEEFLELNGKDINKIRENPDLWKKELLSAFYRYVKMGMLPELAKEEDEEFGRRYILNNLIDRIIYKDLPDEFEIRDRGLLKSLVYITGKNPGMLLDYKALSKNLGKDQRTIKEYFEYLEFGLLTKIISNYRGSSVSSARRLKKVYPSIPCIIFALTQDFNRVLPEVLEDLVLFHSHAEFFYKENIEVDFLKEEGSQILAIEVKLKAEDAKQIKWLSTKFRNKKIRPLMIDLEKETKIDGVNVIPLWKWLLNI